MSAVLGLLVLAATGTATRGLSLADAVELALRSDPRILRAEVARDQADLAVLRARLDRVSVRVDASLQEVWAESGIGSDHAGGATLGLSNLSASLAVPIFAGSRVSATIAKNEHLLGASLDDLLTERKHTSLAVARAYWAVRKMDLLAGVERAALERARRAEEIAAARVHAGLAPPIDLNRARAERLNAEATHADLEGRTAEASAELAGLLGLRSPVVPTDNPRHAAVRPLPAETLILAAHRGRPELRAALRRVEAGRSGITIAKAGYYPELSVSALAEVGNNPAVAGVGAREVLGSANPFSAVGADVQAGLVLSMNLFDTYHTETAVREATYALERLEAEERQATRVVEAEVTKAHARVEHQHAVKLRLRPVEEVARDNLEIIQRRYENGDAPMLELVDAEVALLAVERRIADTTAELELAWIELDASLGVDVGEKP